MGKKFIISLIRFYQRHASLRLRAACRFTPTCSEYAVLAIEKYGVISGIVRGFRRVISCHEPNGGVDYP